MFLWRGLCKSAYLCKAAFTIKEVRELIRLPSVGFEPIAPSLFPPTIDKLPRTAKRLMQLLSQGSSVLPNEVPRSWSLDFLLSPTSFNSSVGAPHDLSSVTFVKNKLQGPNPLETSATAVSTGENAIFSASLAFRSIGYKSEALPGMEDIGIHFDADRGVLSTDYDGRVTAPSETGGFSAVPGMYCSGWVKSGPAGVIANTMEDAFATAAAITNDWNSNALFLAGDGGWDLLKQDPIARGLRSVCWDSWNKIDAAERQRGKMKGKEREKFTSTEQMLQVLD